MIPVELLFRTVPGDDETTLWGPHFALTSTSSAAASITLAMPAIPNRRLFWVTNLVCTAEPGAAQNFERMTIIVTDAQSNNLALIGGSPDAKAAGVDAIVSVDNPFLIMSNHLIQCFAVFNAGVAANDVTISATGYMTVRGNAAQF